MDANLKPMKWWFHQHAEGTHLLFESFVIENSLSRFFGYLFIFAICWSERGLTYFLERQNYHSSSTDGGGNISRLKKIGLRTLLYGTATTLRLWYMLITMYFIIDFFVVVVLALTSGQLIIEFLKSTRSSSSAYHVPEGEDGDSIQHLHHRHSSSTSGYTSFEYKEAQHNDIHVISTASPPGSGDNSKRRSRHRDDISEEHQRLFTVPTDHEEFELTRSTH
ncbi:hypothetical protein BDC45DRAFT_515888 [Circinella umbellata]|nr:hypothetical protein BDC45DRAFT_515888 [Circinella umbellata]